mgnify:CR=1 FL=1
MKEDLNSAERKKGFLSFGEDETDLDGSYEYAVVGDKEGFLYLRDKIDELLDSDGEIALADERVDTWISHLKIAEYRPEKAVEETWKDKCFIFGCFLVVALFGWAMMLGILELFKKLMSGVL